MQTVGKIFFALIFLGGMLAVVGTILGSLGALPDSVYSNFYQIEETLSARVGADNSAPSFRQFEGHWKVEMRPNVVESDIATCVNVGGYVLSHNGGVSGTLHGFNPYMNVALSLTINQSGGASGVIKANGGYSGSLTGMINNGVGKGTWSDNLDCAGTLTFTKVLPAVDPVAGHIVSTHGSVTLNRNGQMFATYPGMLLYSDDILITADGASAHLGIGFNNTATDIGSGSSYAVPNVPGQ